MLVTVYAAACQIVYLVCLCTMTSAHQKLKDSLGIPKESDLEGPQDLITRLLGETETPVLEGTNKTLHAPRLRGKEQ